MTETTRKIIHEFEKELEELSEKEQEKYAKSFLQDLRRRKEKKEGRKGDQEGKELYEPFRIMLDADLDFPSDYSETYEERLYGAKKQND